MKLYGFVNLRDDPASVSRDEFRSSIRDQRVKSLFVIDEKVDVNHRIYQWAREDGIGNLVIGYRDNPLRPNVPRLERTMSLTKRIAMGNTGTHEWAGRAFHAHPFLNCASTYGFEWVCTLCVSSFLSLFNAQRRCREEFRILIAKKHTEILMLCGFVLVGYQYRISQLLNVPLSWKKMDLHQTIGFTKERMRDFVSDWDITSGCNWQEGVDLDVIPLLRTLNFKGALCGLPFHLPKDSKVLCGNIVNV